MRCGRRGSSEHNAATPIDVDVDVVVSVVVSVDGDGDGDVAVGGSPMQCR